MGTRNWPEPWPDIDTTLSDLAAATDQANPPQAADGTIDDLARRLDLIERIQAVLREMHEHVTETLIAEMEDETVLTGSGMLRRVERRGSSKWNDDDAADRMRSDIVRAIADDIALDVATGEMDPMKRNVASAAVSSLLADLGKSWRLLVAGQRRLGVWENEYKTSGAVTYRVELEGTDEP